MTEMKKWVLAFGLLIAFATAIVLGGTYLYQNEINGYPIQVMSQTR